MRVLSAVVLSAALTLPGCYGRFALTKSLHGWNGQIGSRWVNSLVFFGLAVVQAYSICLLGDGLIFNTVEFWTGDNPVARVEEDGSIVVARYRLVPLADARWGVELDGRRIGQVEVLADGGLAIADEASARSAVVTAEELDAIALQYTAP